MMVDTQDTKPRTEISLSEVGVTNVKTLVRINRMGQKFTFVPSCEVTINLPSNRKGAHLSRLVESVTEILSSKSEHHSSIEEMTIKTLSELHTRHHFVTARMKLNFDFIIKRKTPITKKRSLEVYPIELITIAHNGIQEFYHRVTIQSNGNTVCPHAFAESQNQFTHIQRAVGELSIEANTEDIPLFEAIADVLESSYSAPTYSVLKTPDEQATVEKMFKSPYFAEDVCRNILSSSDKKFKGAINIIAKVTSQESIHKHDVLSKGCIIRNKKILALFNRK